jgi:hypothetical protein
MLHTLLELRRALVAQPSVAVCGRPVTNKKGRDR